MSFALNYHIHVVLERELAENRGSDGAMWIGLVWTSFHRGIGLKRPAG